MISQVEQILVSQICGDLVGDAWPHIALSSIELTFKGMRIFTPY